VRAVFVLLTAYALLDKLADLVFYVRELVMSLNKFHGPCDAWVSVQWVIVMTADYLLFQFFGNVSRYALLLLD
jgi:hypothetical protein